MRIGYRNPQGGASAGSTVWHSWLTTPAAHAPLIACGAVVSVEVAPAHTITPAEAVEALYAREAPLWPWSPGDDAAPRWWCERCDGSGRADEDERGLWWPCRRCDGGHTAVPPTLAALIAVASLGAPTLRAVEELARVIVGRAPRIVWRVMTRERIDADVPRPTREAYDSVRALRDLIDIGVHPYSLDASRIALAVAAI